MFTEWFEADPQLVSKVLFKEFETLLILRSTVSDGSPGPGSGTGKEGLGIQAVYPNPAGHKVTVEFIASGDKTQVTVYSMTGQQVQSHVLNKLAPGKHRVELEVSDLPAGNYHLILQSGIDRKSTSFSVIR